MSDVGGVGNRVPLPLSGDNQAVDKLVKQPGQFDPFANNGRPDGLVPNLSSAVQDVPAGPPGQLGQPTGMPLPPDLGQVLPDVLAGRDPTQMTAAEQMRQAGGGSAIAELLGLNQLPTVIGAFPAPPGNLEVLRKMTPALRRQTVRELLTKQRAQMRRLVTLLKRDSDEHQREGEENGNPYESLNEVAQNDELPNECEWKQLANAARMLMLLEELLAMQDYTLSRIGTFSKG
jgi:hypothetical protein